MASTSEVSLSSAQLPPPASHDEHNKAALIGVSVTSGIVIIIIIEVLAAGRALFNVDVLY